MNILLIGSGGREHALAWKIRQSKRCTTLFIAPGNAGTASLGENLPIAVDDFAKLGAACLQHAIDLVIVGPEVPLVKGIRNYFEHDEKLKSILLVGPDQAGAQLEGSKDFSKQFMLRHGVPTAKAATFLQHQVAEAKAYLEKCTLPIVLKADGLAAGKGVIITSSREEAIKVIEEMLVDKKFGEASSKVLVEEFLDGIELSVFVLTDGNDYVILPEAKDYKRIGDGDKGPNTGGMGSVSPVPFAGKDFMKKVEAQVVEPTIRGLKQEGINYKGFIFIGLMNVNGEPYVIEYNARMGDPETQSVMMRIDQDLVELLVNCAQGTLTKQPLNISTDHALTIVMAAGGYPESYKKGDAISGLTNELPAQVFHAGTKSSGAEIITDGGRVLAVTGRGATLKEAQAKAYAAARALHWNGAYFRSDIGNDLLAWRN